MRNKIASFIEKSLSCITDAYCNSNEKPSEDVLITVSLIYAFVYDSQKLFIETINKGRLMSETEIRFNRLASPSEMNLSLQDLEVKWLSER